MFVLAMPGPTQLWIIALIVLLLFGARKLPDLARAMGSSISQFKRGLKDGERTDDPEGEEGGQTRRVEQESAKPRDRM